MDLKIKDKLLPQEGNWFLHEGINPGVFFGVTFSADI